MPPLAVAMMVADLQYLADLKLKENTLSYHKKNTRRYSSLLQAILKTIPPNNLFVTKEKLHGQAHPACQSYIDIYCQVTNMDTLDACETLGTL